MNPYILTPEEREQFKQRIAKARNDGPFTPIGFDEVIHMPGNSGRSRTGAARRRNPNDGSVYVISFNVPTIIRLLKPGEVRTAAAAVRRAPSSTRGPLMTDGFGLYATIVNPPYTTLTAYDLNEGTIKWQIGLGDDLRLVAAGHQGHRHGGHDQGSDHPDRDGPALRHRAPTARCTSTTAPAASNSPSCRSAGRRADHRRCTN